SRQKSDYKEFIRHSADDAAKNVISRSYIEKSQTSQVGKLYVIKASFSSVHKWLVRVCHVFLTSLYLSDYSSLQTPRSIFYDQYIRSESFYARIFSPARRIRQRWGATRAPRRGNDGGAGLFWLCPSFILLLLSSPKR